MLCSENRGGSLLAGKCWLRALYWMRLRCSVILVVYTDGHNPQKNDSRHQLIKQKSRVGMLVEEESTQLSSCQWCG